MTTAEKISNTPEKRDIALAAIQMVSGTNVDENLLAAERLINRCVAKGSEFVLLPEFFAVLAGSTIDPPEFSEDYGDGPIQVWASDIARSNRIWLCAGTISIRADDGGRPYNACILFDPQGSICARYDKMHLFKFQRKQEQYEEANIIRAGDQPVSCQAPFGHLGFSVCYDLRFPELYRRMMSPNPLDLIVVPAAFTETTGQAHWQILLRARAIENQCYVIAAAQGGKHPNGRRTHGESMIIDPWGEILDLKKKGAGWVMATLRHQRIAEVRQKLPALGSARWIKS